MKVSLEWLNEYIDISNIPEEELYNKLSLHSIEIDENKKLINSSNLVIGYVKEISKHPNADKLNVCLVDIGNEVLQIVCGANNISKDQKVIVALVGALLPGNFKIKKSKIRGVESFGMICSLSEIGIDKNLLLQEELDGIKVLNDTAPIGESPIDFLNLNTIVYELGLTPNRTDLLSYKGISNDIAVIFNLKLKNLKSNQINIDIQNNLKYKFDNYNNYISFTKIKLEQVKDIPNFIISRLIASDIKINNNLLDLVNYSILENGQPISIYDAKHINGEICVSLEKNVEVSISNKLYNFDEAEVIRNNNEIISINDIYINDKYKVNESTKDVLLQIARFDSTITRKVSKKLNIRNLNSIRYERGIPISSTIDALIKFNNNLDTPLSFSDTIENFELNKKELCIDLDLQFINEYLGTNICLKEIHNILLKLGFKIKDNKIFVPLTRTDIKSKIDIIEEVGRIYGYYKIANTLPKSSKQGGLTSFQRGIRKIKKCLNSMNLDQVSTYNLTSQENFNRFDSSNNPLEILNPLSNDKKILRNNLIPSMVEVLQYNKNRSINDINIFEIGKTFNKDEDYSLGIVMNGKFSENTWISANGYNSKLKENVNFYTIKGIIEELFKLLGYSNISFDALDINSMHPGRTASVTVNDQYIGFIGQLHPTYEGELNIKDVYVCNLNISKLLNISNDKLIYKKITKYPTINYDFSIEIKEDINVQEIIDCCYSSKVSILKNISVFDIYKGEKVSKLNKSVALRLLFEDFNNTLERERVDLAFNKIMKKLEVEFNAKLRKE